MLAVVMGLVPLAYHGAFPLARHHARIAMGLADGAPLIESGMESVQLEVPRSLEEVLDPDSIAMNMPDMQSVELMVDGAFKAITAALPMDVTEIVAATLHQVGTLTTQLPDLTVLPGLTLPSEAAQTVALVEQALLFASSPLLAEASPKAIALQLAAVGAFSLGAAICLADGGGEAPYEPGTDTYDTKVADAFYRERPLLVAQRMAKLASLTSAFTAGVLWDWLVRGKLLGDEEYTALKAAEPQRAKEALALCEQLGPTFIKLGQALSIRTDLIPEAYALELRQLQDAVPPFPSEEARTVIKQQLGRSVDTVFSKISPEPVASASIGQVYKATLKGSETVVAVKVQRPGILAEIALDLHVLRLITPIQTYFQNAVNGLATAPEDIEVALQLVDEWGRGFVAETDYRLEARSTLYMCMCVCERYEMQVHETDYRLEARYT